MIPKDILKQIRQIQIKTSRMVTDVFSGQYHSIFKGRGMEFDEVRQYQPGDEIRSIDWNVTARTGEPYVKKYVEERELTVMLLLDMSKSSYFGTVNKLKRQIAAEICSLLAFSAIQNNDKVGLILFTDKIEKYVPPRKGVRHVLRIVREALYYTPQRRWTDISGALEYLNRVTRRSTVSFIISDFYDSGFVKPLSVANKRHDITAVTITDPKEISMPNIGIVQFEDAESGKKYLVDTSNNHLRDEFNKSSLKILEERSKTFAKINVDTVDVRTDLPYGQALFKFFRMRERRLR